MTRKEAIKVLIDVQAQFQASLDEVDVDKDCKEAEEDNRGVVNALEMAIRALEEQPNEDCISRQAAINALWKALHEYEDKTENQFLESKELDVADWFQHRIFVQNMSDIDRQTILNLPSVTPQPNIEQIIKTTIKEYLDKECDDVTELLLALSKDLCERIRKENEDGL